MLAISRSERVALTLASLLALGSAAAVYAAASRAWVVGLAIGTLAIGSVVLFGWLRRIRRRVRHPAGAIQTFSPHEQSSVESMVLTISPDGGIRTWNPQLEFITGRAPAEVDRLAFVDLFAPHDREELSRALVEAKRTGHARCEAALLHRAGSPLPAEWAFMTTRDLTADSSVLIAIARVRPSDPQDDSGRASGRFYDALTGLPNRRWLFQRLDDMLDQAGLLDVPLAVLLVDINHFGSLNDATGPHRGDRLLATVGERLQTAIRQTDVIARFGDDEFGIVLPNTDLDGANVVARAIHQAMEHHITIDGLSLTVETTVGIALFPAHGGTDGQTLCRQAASAIATARGRRDRTGVYTADRDPYRVRRLALLGELRYAIDHGELELVYQPKVQMRTRRVLGVETLVRWHHPNRGTIYPSEFISSAEHSGLIRPLTLWVMNSALGQLNAWRTAGLQLTVAVNLSARNLHDVRLATALGDSLQSAAIPGGQMEIEVAENSLVADPERTVAMLSDLHRLGIGLVIDDFGTGYSSLSFLKRVPISAIKIDRPFVSALATDDTALMIVHSIIELAHNLGLTVTAEGVEDDYTWERLLGMECDAAQGFYIGEPMSVDALNRWFVDSPWTITRIAPSTDSAEAA